MKTDIRTLWTDALRSGDYTQGSGVLKTTPGDFCCLGVLCELAVKAEVIPPVEEIKTPDDHLIGYKYGSETGVLPTEVMEWAGLKDTEGLYDMSDEEMEERYGAKWVDNDYYRKSSLINANDSYNKNFSQIADLIDKHFS